VLALLANGGTTLIVADAFVEFYVQGIIRPLGARVVKTSLFEIFKIGIGPSSSHTVGPMLAAGEFVCDLGSKHLLPSTRRIAVDLYGSLALTGYGSSSVESFLSLGRL
jgi:hypothetical protein